MDDLKIGKHFDVQDPEDPVPKGESEYGGAITNLDPISAERRYVTTFLLVGVFALLFAGLSFGAFTGDWTPFERSQAFAFTICGFIMGHYFPRRK